MNRIQTLLIFISLILVNGCANLPKTPMPNDFNFTLIYGVYGKEKIDTFNNIVVKDLVEDGTLEANISLTKKEKQAIYDEMMKIDIMGDLKLDDLDKENVCEAEPSTITQWNIQMNGEIKTFSYTTYCEYPEDVLNLIELKDFIHTIFTEKKEYRELPDATGEYL